MGAGAVSPTHLTIGSKHSTSTLPLRVEIAQGKKDRWIVNQPDQVFYKRKQ